MGRIGTHSEWTILAGFLPALLGIAVLEPLTDPELVKTLIDDLASGLGSAARFVRSLIMMSTVVTCYVALCLALLEYFVAGLKRTALPIHRKRALAWAGIASWIGFHAVLAGLSSLDLRLFSIAYDSLVAALRAGWRSGGHGDDRGLACARHLATPCLDSASG